MEPHNSSSERGASQPNTKKAGCPVPSCVSMKSDHSHQEPLNFRSGPVPSDSTGMDGMLQDQSRSLQYLTDVHCRKNPLTIPNMGVSRKQEYLLPGDDLPSILERHKTCMKNKHSFTTQGPCQVDCSFGQRHFLWCRLCSHVHSSHGSMSDNMPLTACLCLAGTVKLGFTLMAPGKLVHNMETVTELLSSSGNTVPL
ncbi:hypothetical protein MHYP_G00092950 [Metynnis hypsauchen]